jgi:hypothetical protein
LHAEQIDAAALILLGLFIFMRITIIEPSKTGVEHASFNSAVVKRIHDLLGKDVQYFCSRPQYDLLNRDIAWTGLPVVSITKRAFVKKLLVEAFALVYAFGVSRRRGARQVLLLSVFPPLLNLLPVLARLSGIKPFVILHGELDGLVEKKRQKLTSYGYWIKLFFDRKHYKNIRCIVLGHGIQLRLADLYPESVNYNVVLNHPIKRSTRWQVRKDIDFATFGIATSERYSKLYAYLESIPEDRRPRLVHIGICEKALFERFHDVVTFLCKPGDSLSVEAYEHAASRVRCALSLYESNDYRLRVSGAMLDALSAGARLVSFPCSYALDLERDGFDVVLVNSLDELVDYMLRPPPEHVGIDASNGRWNEYTSENFAKKLLEVME